MVGHTKTCEFCGILSGSYVWIEVCLAPLNYQCVQTAETSEIEDGEVKEFADNPSGPSLNVGGTYILTKPVK